MASIIEDDDSIIGRLREQIVGKKEEPISVFKPANVVAFDMPNDCIDFPELEIDPSYAVSLCDPEVKEWDRKTNKKPRRIPRKWFAPFYYLYKFIVAENAPATSDYFQLVLDSVSDIVHDLCTKIITFISKGDHYENA